MEGCLDEVAEGVDECLAGTLYGTEHDVGTYASVEVGLAVDIVAEVVAVGFMLLDVPSRISKFPFSPLKRPNQIILPVSSSHIFSYHSHPSYRVVF